MDRRSLLLGCAVALLPFLLLVWRFDFVCDDAYISFRYAQNLALGRGLRFNLGVDPPVEGYSELLWVLLVAGSLKLQLAPELVTRVVSVACGVALLVLTVRSIARCAGQRRFGLVGAALFLGTLTPLAVWTTGGMGTVPFLLAVFLTHTALLDDPERPRPVMAAAAAATTVLLRADGAHWLALILGTGAVAAWRGRDRRLGRAVLIVAAASGACLVAHVAWRVSYYGDYLPNTARVKVGLSPFVLARGARYVGHFLLTFPSLLVALALPLALGRRGLDRRTGPALALVLGTFAYAVLVGGDFMCFGRFLLPALPFLAVLLARGLAGMEERGWGVAVLPLSATLAACSLLPAFDRALVPVGVRRALHFRYNAGDLFRSEYGQWSHMRLNVTKFRLVGRALNMYTKPEATLVTGGIGAVAYFSDRFLYDQNGLVTREVALRPPSKSPRSPGHDKAVTPEYFLDRNPTFLRAFLADQRKPLPEGVRPRRDLIVPLPRERGFPEGAMLVAVRPPRRQ